MLVKRWSLEKDAFDNSDAFTATEFIFVFSPVKDNSVWMEPGWQYIHLHKTPCPRMRMNVA